MRRALMAVAVLLALVPSVAQAIGSAAILSHAAAYAEHTWVMGSKNKKGWCTGSYSSDYSPGTQKGVPYDWGGFDTIDGFDQKIADGYGAGSHSWHGVLECTTGVDCSGFVSRCWELTTKYSTSTIGEVSHSIAKKDVAAGDAYNKPGSHIVLWVKTAGDGGPVFYEASGSASKVRLNTAASWSYLSGYSPIRYDGYDAAAAQPMTGGTVSNPIVISSFPFHHDADTTASASDAFDSYSCAAGTGEKGPEVVYRVDLAAAGTLTAQVSDAAGVDVDVHLLAGPSASECLARDDVKVSLALAAGTYWLVVDSWSDSSGIAYGGAYSLDVTFSAQPPPVQEAAGTFADPIVIQAFPYHDERSTTGGKSDAADAYACAPEKGEKGPEVVYRLTVTVAGKVKATVSDGDGVDIDLHLLWAPDPAACLARDDTKVEAAVQPGTYWLVADSWSSSTGKEYPGAYVLDATFTSDTPCTPDCAGKQCGWNGCWGWCGYCAGGQICEAGLCVASEQCGDGKCDGAAGETCASCLQDCPCGCGQTCVANVCALTVCWGRTCGPDGCGGYCGQCAATDFCDHGNCAALAGTEPKQGDCSDKEECEPPENEGDRPPPPGFEPDATGGADASQSFLVEGEDGDGGGGSGCSVAAPNLGGPAACLLLLSLATMILAAPRTGRAGAR